MNKVCTTEQILNICNYILDNGCDAIIGDFINGDLLQDDLVVEMWYSVELKINDHPQVRNVDNAWAIVNISRDNSFYYDEAKQSIADTGVSFTNEFSVDEVIQALAWEVIRNACEFAAHNHDNVLRVKNYVKHGLDSGARED